jgi:hypothetical protein
MGGGHPPRAVFLEQVREARAEATPATARCIGTVLVCLDSLKVRRSTCCESTLKESAWIVSLSFQWPSDRQE